MQIIVIRLSGKEEAKEMAGKNRETKNSEEQLEGRKLKESVFSFILLWLPRQWSKDIPSNMAVFLFPSEPGGVIWSKIELFAAAQANRWRDTLLGQRLVTLSREPVDQEDDGLTS